MTLVWQTQRDELIQIQMSIIDIVNTWSAAASVYEWLEETERLLFLFDRLSFRNKFRERLCELNLDHQLRLQSLRAFVLTSNESLIAHIDDMQDSFKDDLRTQIIDTIICALTHELDRFTAANLFRRFLMPYLFDEKILLLNILHSQLLETSTLQKIINEESSRDLNDLFLKTAATLDVSFTDQEWRNTMSFVNRDDFSSREVHLIVEFFKWLVNETELEYRIRNVFVTRVAVYLKVVGHSIGSIHFWIDHKRVSSSIDARCLLLIFEKFSKTDICMFDSKDVQIIKSQPRFHYQFSTINALLLSAIKIVVDIASETLQKDFQHIFVYIQKHLKIIYEIENGSTYATYK